MKKLLLLALLQVGGQSSPTVEVTNASAEEVGEKIAASSVTVSATPGRWEGATAITNIEVLGMPPEAAAKMKERLIKVQAFAKCVTPERGKRTPLDFVAKEGDCRYDYFRMTNDRIDAKMQCNRDGKAIDETITIQFSNDRYQMTATSWSAGTPGQPMSAYTMTLKTESRHTGECKGDEKH